MDATELRIHWFALGKSTVKHQPAPALVEDMADLTQYVKGLLRKTPVVLDCTIELEGFAPVEVRYRAICHTVSMILLPPRSPKDKLPDAVCLLVNGLEGPEDIAMVKSKVTFPDKVWQALDRSKKPVAVFTFNVNGRMRDPATVTVLTVFANVYFALLGTNFVEDGEG